MQEALYEMVCGTIGKIVDHPDEVDVILVPTSYKYILELRTNRDDVGQVIGKAGYVIEALRAIISAFAGKHRVRITLDYVTEKQKLEDERNTRRRSG